MKFDNLGLVEPILRAVQGEGYETATPIQAKAIPLLLEGRDIIGCAQTGTGKTAAFALPTLQRLRDSSNGKRERTSDGRKKKRRKIRALVLSPTRELASQIQESFASYGRFTGLRQTVIYGGVSQGRQVRALQKGVDTLVATPGRLLDLIGQGYIDLSNIEILILDEADRMLDMGFIHDLRQIVKDVPAECQTLMFSATMPREIRQLASQWLTKPAHVQIAQEAAPAEKVEQSVYLVEPRQKLRLLAHFLENTPSTRTLVFSRTKHGADKIVQRLTRNGIKAGAIHGNKSQSARQRVLESFKSDRLPVLIATDIAARGLDVDDISHVINFDMPHDAETYVHRIGRTARAGAEGIAVSFCGRDERPKLRSIERLIRRTISVQQQPKHLQEAEETTSRPAFGAKGKKTFGGKSRPQHQRRSKSKSKPKSKGSFPAGGAKTVAPASRAANRRQRRAKV